MNTAAYSVGRKTPRGKAKIILIECAEGAGNVPRKASVADLGRVAAELRDQLDLVTATAESVLDALKAVQPGKVQIEFGVELGAELNIPVITKGSAKANFKITLTWEETKGSD